MKTNWMAGLTALGLAVCLAEEPKKAADSKPVKQGGQAGMVIVKTPDGGLRAPTAEEYQVLTGQGGANLRSTAAPQQEVLGGGKGVRLALDPAVTEVFSVVTKGPDGKLVMQEAVGAKAAERLVKAGAPAGKDKQQ